MTLTIDDIETPILLFCFHTICMGFHHVLCSCDLIDLLLVFDITRRHNLALIFIGAYSVESYCFIDSQANHSTGVQSRPYYAHIFNIVFSTIQQC